MATSLSRIRFALRSGGIVTTTTGTWRYFDTDIGCIEDWSGILSEAPIGGDIIEQDWVDGAIWQQGESKTYTFDVPFTARVSNPIDPNIWDAWSGPMAVLRSFRGVQLTMRREFFDTSGALRARHQALGVLATGLTMKVSIGRVLGSALMFQNLSGGWVTVSLT